MTGNNDLKMLPDEFLDLLARKAVKPLPDDQEERLAAWIRSNPERDQECQDFIDEMKKFHLLFMAGGIDQHQAWQQISAGIHNPFRRRKVHFRIMGYAALILLFIALGWYLVSTRSEKADSAAVTEPLPERHNKAVLVLSNGEQRVLDQPGQTVMKEEGDITITNKPGEVLAYGQGEAAANGRVMNSLIVPSGARYQVRLSDGTKVWMNAVSTLEYPVAFSEKERRVSLTGEAYFEVNQDINKPFVIESNGYAIKVLGTSFNVSTYPEDPFLETTLVEGSVMVTRRDGKEVHLNPGQMLKISHEDQSSVVQDVDTRFFTSWKDGILYFNKVTLGELTLKLERWYDVEIGFMNPEAEKLIYSGAMENSRKIEFLLNLIEQTADVKFEVGEDKIVVK